MVSLPRILELDRQRASEVILEDVPELLELVGSVGVEVPPQPEGFTLASLRDGRLRVVEPIRVAQMVEEGRYVIEASELNEFGFGDNFSEAIQDLQEAIAELYLTLEAEQGQLGPDLASVWNVVARKVRRADAAVCP